MFNNWNSYEHEEIWRHTDAHRRMQCEDRNRVVSWGATKRSSGNHHSWERQGGFFSRVFRSSMAWLLLQSCTARPKICETINRHCLKLLFVAPCQCSSRKQQRAKFRHSLHQFSRLWRFPPRCISGSNYLQSTTNSGALLYWGDNYVLDTYLFCPFQGRREIRYTWTSSHVLPVLPCPFFFKSNRAHTS